MFIILTKNQSRFCRTSRLLHNENDSIGLIGANGVGKSTLLKLLVGLNLDYEAASVWRKCRL